MEEKNKLMPKKVTMLDKIRNALRKLTGYKEGKKFIIDTRTNYKKIFSN